MPNANKKVNKILYVIGSLNIGGAEQHLTKVVCQLEKKDWEIGIFSHNDSENSLTQKINETSIKLFLTRYSNNLPFRSILKPLYCLFKLIKCIRNFKPTIIHFFLPESYILGSIAAFITGVPIKLMSRRSQNLYQQKNSFYKLIGKLEKCLHPHMDLILGNSKNIIHELSNEGVLESQLKLIYNGIDVPNIMNRKLARETTRLPQNVLIMTIIANLINYKGHMDLLNALSLIKDQLPKNWQLNALGYDSGIMNSLKQHVNLLELDKHVFFKGSKADVLPWIASSDIGLLVSHTEGFSNAILEFMSMGIPMIATDVGGNKEAIIHGETGLIVPAKNPKELSDAILNLVNNPNRIKMGELGRKRIIEHF